MYTTNQSASALRAPKLSEVLFGKPDRSFGSLAAMPSNVEAIEAGLRFSAGRLTHVALVGPSGWGKTHLLETVAYRLSHLPGMVSEPISALNYLGGGMRADQAAPLVLDDCQEVFGRPRLHMTLRFILERRVRAGRPTLLAFTQPKADRALRSLLPGTHEWTVATMGAPEATERTLLVNQMASIESLALSPGLVRIIATQMHGNGRTLAGAFKRLRLSGTDWLDAAATLRACGLLDPFFADNSGWDLKLRILRTAESSRALFSRVSWNDLAVYTMLQVACLAESDVARCIGLTPAEAYGRASRFAREIERDPTVEAHARQFVEIVVASLTMD